MALDRRQIKARLAALLVEERGRRAPDGSGDARKFPQPKMAELLGYSLRQYQRLEDPDDSSIPLFDDLQRVLGKLGRGASDIYGDDEGEEATDGLMPTEVDRASEEERLRQIVREELGAVLEVVERLEGKLEKRLREAQHRAAGRRRQSPPG